MKIAQVSVALFIIFYAGFATGHKFGENKVRALAAEKAKVCETIVAMRLPDWQAAVGVPLTQQVTCKPLHDIAEGRQ